MTETATGSKLELHFDGSRCIHARFCVTGAPTVFLANVQGPWIHPDAMPRSPNQRDSAVRSAR